MTDATQPRMARGTTLSAGFIAAALFALLAFAPFASAAPDPLGGGTTTITLKSGVVNAWKKRGVKLSKVSPATLKGSKATFTVTGGSLDPTTGLGTVTLGGGFKFKAGSKTATVKGLVLDTSKKALTANVGGKKMKMATIAGSSFVRNGFGVNLTIKSLKLTGPAAKQLNEKLGYTGKKAKGKAKGKGKASASKTVAPPFKANQAFGSATSEPQPKTVAVLPGGTTTLAANPATLAKLTKAGVTIPVSAPTTEPSKSAFAFPVTGGTFGPAATAGVVQTDGGLRLLQKIQTGATSFLETEITLGKFYVDLAAKTVSVEVVLKSNASADLNRGAIGRASIADLSLTGATVAIDPVNRTVNIQNAGAALQLVAASVLDGFRQVAQAALAGRRQLEGKPKAEAEAEAAAFFADAHINAETRWAPSR